MADDAPKRIHQGTRPGGRSARVRDAVLGAALAELVEVGYGALSLPRIAERAGVALSTVHRRWRNKAGLLTDAIRDAAAVRVPDPQGDDLRSDLIALATSVATMLREPAVVAVLRSAFALPDAELDELRHRFWAERFTVAQAIIDRAIARGELARGTDGWVVVEPIHARIWMRLLITGLPLDDAQLVTIVDQVVRAARREELET